MAHDFESTNISDKSSLLKPDPCTLGAYPNDVDSVVTVHLNMT
jgi:hypothetical protein